MKSDAFRRENRPQIFQRAIHAGRHLKRVSAELGRELNDHPRLTLDQSGSYGGRRRPQHLGDILEANARAALTREYSLSQLLRCDGLALGLDNDPLILGLDETGA